MGRRNARGKKIIGGIHKRDFDRGPPKDTDAILMLPDITVVRGAMMYIQV